MNRLIDQFLDQQSLNKSKSETLNNHQNNYGATSKSQNQLNIDAERPSLQRSIQNESSQVIEITEEIIFERHDFQSNSLQKTRPNITSYRTKILQNNQKNEEQIESNETNNFIIYNPKLQQQQDYSSQNENYYQDQSGSVQQTFLRRQGWAAQDIGKITSMNQVKIIELLNGISQTKQSHVRFVQWFQEQKQEFNMLMIENKSQIIDKFKSLIQNIRQQQRSKIEQQLRAEFERQNLNQNSSTNRNENQMNNFNSRHNIQTESFSQNNDSVLSMQRKWEIEKRLIKQELQQRYQYKIEKLEQQLEEKKKFEQFNLTASYNQRQSSFSQTDYNGLLEELEALKKELQQKDALLQELQIQNQQLNQHIFDVEQKISGIELEVELRVRQKLKEISIEHVYSSHHTDSAPKLQLHPILETSSNLEQTNRTFAIHSINLHQQKVEQLSSQNQKLKALIQQLQKQKFSIQNQLKQTQKIILFREDQIKRNQEDISFQWAEIERERQSLLIREQELTLAQENISKKISDLRAKQTEIQSWEAQYHKRQAGLEIRQEEINSRLMELVERENLFKLQKQSFVLRTQKQTNSQYNSRKNIQLFNTQSQSNIQFHREEIPELPIGRKLAQQQDYNKYERNSEKQYQFRNKIDPPKYIINTEKNYEDLDRSYSRYNKQKERFVSTNANLKTARQGHQYVLPQSSKLQYPSRSQSRSKEKSILGRNNFNPINPLSSIGMNSYKNTSYKGPKFMQQHGHNKQQNNLDGLGSKLQRLREQIKRQIQSIK